PEQAMYRELLEEIGLTGDDVEVLGCTDDWLRYELPRRFRRRGGNPVCIGQKQRWFLLRMTADEGRVQLDGGDEPEFDRWRWVDFWHPLRSVIWFKRKVYEAALNELAPLLFPDGAPPRPR
ncbi:MAG: RNA pyrophosphohydrolase, partial [Pseudomonadota bacterium]